MKCLPTYQSKETNMNTLTFNDVNFNPVERNGQIWLTSGEIAKALGYKNTKSISNLYSANADEFTPAMTEVIDSVTSAKTKGLKVRTRIFSLRGCHALGFFARTDIAKAFRQWVLDILDKEVGVPVQTNLLSTVADRKPLGAAVNTFCAKTGAFYADVWKMVHQRFDLEGVHEMTVEQVPQAIDYVHGLLAQVQYGGLNVDIAMDNEMWRCVGILKYYELSKALDEAKKAVNVLYSAIGSAQSHGSLVYDAFGEQRKLTALGEGGSHTALEQAKAFIERQDARKHIWGGR